MAMTTKDICPEIQQKMSSKTPAKTPAETPAKTPAETPKIKKETIQDKLKNVGTAKYRNNGKSPVIIRLDSIDNREWVTIKPGEMKEIPPADAEKLKNDNGIMLLTRIQ